MPQRDCPQCGRRLPYAARRCLACGWAHREGVDAAAARAAERRRGWTWLLVLLLLAIGGGAAAWNAGTVADWYAGFAAHHLPTRMSGFAPTDTEAGAFFYCARHVVKRMDGEFSVETFPSPSEGHTLDLGEGRYRVVSWVEEARANGARVRHGFECLTRYQRGRWILERLQLERYAEDGTPPAFALTHPRPSL